MPSKNIIIKLLSFPYKGKKLEFSKNTDPEEVFTGLVLRELEWETILPLIMNPDLKKQWLKAELLVRMAYQEILFSRLKEEMEKIS